MLVNMESVLKLKPVRDNYYLAFSRVTDYYNQLLRTKRREFGPEEISIIVEWIHSQWKSWINEFFCDLFALYTVGPAYAWSHLHLTTKRSDDIHELTILQKQTHPSDESRMRILIHGLRSLGFDKEAEKISSRWVNMAGYWGLPSAEYQYAYPNSLLMEITKLILEALRESGFSAVSHVTLTNDNGSEIRVMLNEAWEVFWKSKPKEFRSWEEKRVAALRECLHS